MRFFRHLLVAVFVAVGLAVTSTRGAEAKKIRVLIVDGQNNHDWLPTTAWLRDFLTSSGRCLVAVTTTPSKETPSTDATWSAWRPRFTDFDVVLSNFNGGHQPNATRWPAEVERSFEDYVRSGGGFVSFHAANNAFLGWPAYNEMIGLLWRDPAFGPSVILDEQDRPVIIPTGEGRKPGHGPRHDFQMTTLAGDHPITRGLPRHWMHPSEQLTHGQHGPDAAVRSGAITFLTCAWSKDTNEREPMDWVRNYGKGRVYVTMLGHTWKNEPSPNLHCAGFQTLLLRGVEWAATGTVTIPTPPDLPTADKISLRER